jgi:sugar/nucleoside kinase (ribokinase family)
VGDDTVGQRIRNELTEAGVDCSNLLEHVGIASAICTVIVDDNGERLVVPFYDPAMPADPSWLNIAMVGEADAVMIDVRLPQGGAMLLDAARAERKPAVLDGDIGPRDVLLDLAGRATHAVFSEGGAMIASEQASAAEALDWLDKELDAVVAITLGANGCLWMDRGRAVHVAGHQVRSVDTLAAGDVFHGTLTWALAQRVAMPEAIKLANAAAAIKCQTFGGRLGAPDRAALQAFLEERT